MLDFSLKETLLAIITGSALLTILSPLVVTQHSYFPFLYSKSSLIQIFVEIMVAAFIILVARFPDYRPNLRNPMVHAVILFLCTLLITLPFSINISNSFFSSSSRMTGVFQYLHYFSFFLILVSVFKTWKEWKTFFFTSNIAALVASFFGFMQMNGLAEKRISSVMGNPIFLGVFALVGVFVALILLLKEDERKMQAFYGFSIAVNIIALLLSASRGPLLGLAVALFVGFLLLAATFLTGKARFGVIFATLAIFSVIIGSFALLRSAPVKDAVKDQLPFVISRMVYSDLGNDRFEVWDIGLQGFMDRPIFGWGLENFVIPGNLYIDRANFHGSLMDTWYDKVHNQFIEMLVLTGVVGFSGYVYLWGTTLWLSLKMSLTETDQSKKIIFIVLFAFFMSQITNLMFLFHTPNTLPGLMSLFGFLAFLYNDKIAFKASGREMKILSHKYAGLLSLLVILPMAYVMYMYTFLPFYQSSLNAKGVLAVSSGDLDTAVSLYEKSLKYKTHINDELTFFAHDAISNRAKIGDESPAMERYLTILADQFEIQIQNNPNDYRSYIFAAEVNRWLSFSDASRLDHAKELAKTAIQFGPYRTEAYQELAEIALVKYQPDEALSYLLDAGKRAGKMPALSGEIRVRAASAFFEKHDHELAFSVLMDAAKSGYPIYGDPRIASDIANNYDKKMDLPLAISIVDRIWTVYRDHSKVLHARAVLYHAAGDDTAVQSIVNIVKTTDPQYADFMSTEFGLSAGDSYIDQN